MILYHGSNISFDHIDLTKSLPNKDFGKGFYLSDNYEQAEEMAKFKVVISGGKVVVQSYQTEDAILVDRRAREHKGTIVEKLAFYFKVQT